MRLLVTEGVLWIGEGKVYGRGEKLVIDRSRGCCAAASLLFPLPPCILLVIFLSLLPPPWPTLSQFAGHRVKSCSTASLFLRRWKPNFNKTHGRLVTFTDGQTPPIVRRSLSCIVDRKTINSCSEVYSMNAHLLSTKFTIIPCCQRFYAGHLGGDIAGFPSQLSAACSRLKKNKNFKPFTIITYFKCD